jgi:hypothetical protein
MPTYLHLLVNAHSWYYLYLLRWGIVNRNSRKILSLLVSPSPIDLEI